MSPRLQDPSPVPQYRPMIHGLRAWTGSHPVIAARRLGRRVSAHLSLAPPVAPIIRPCRPVDGRLPGPNPVVGYFGDRSMREKAATGTLLDNLVARFREKIQTRYRLGRQRYSSGADFRSGDFGEILCFEIHSQPDNGRPPGENGLTFKELAEKWDVSVSFLGEVIADHCRKLEGS